MSIHVMAPVWKACPYEGKKLLVLLALCDFADAEGYCWPKMEQIKELARCSTDYARDCIRDFERDGWVTTKVNHGRGHSNEYVIHKNPVSRRVSKTRVLSAENPPSSTPSGLYNSPSKQPPQEGDEDEAPATVEGDAAARVASCDSPPSSGGALDGNPENRVSPDPKEKYVGLPRGQIRTKMREARAYPSEVKRVMEAPVPWEAFAEWDQNRVLPDRETRAIATGQKKPSMWDVL